MHASDVPYVLGALDAALAAAPNAADLEAAALIQVYWVGFARIGNPNGAGRPYWPSVGVAIRTRPRSEGEQNASGPRVILHGYFRSSASYRVRIALGLKGLAHEHVFHHLRKNEQRAPDYLATNPQGLVPSLVLDDGQVLTQSLAICDYLDEVWPEPPLLPKHPVQRAMVRAFAQVIACDIHPLQNLKVLRRLAALGHSEADTQAWARAFIDEGLDACANLIADESGPFCFGAVPSLADLCLIPQLANARRFGVELRWPRLLEAERACANVAAFVTAAPEHQADSE